MKLTRGIFATALLVVAWMFLPTLVTIALVITGATWFVRRGFGVTARS